MARSFHRSAFSLALALGSLFPMAAGAASSEKIALTIHVRDFAFAPTPVHVHVGDRVRFINDDDEAHTVTADDKTFDSEGLDTGQSWEHVFTKPGTFRYFCELHPYMKGIIMVDK